MRLSWRSRIPDSDNTRTIRQQYQRQQNQLSEIKLRMRELIGEYKTHKRERKAGIEKLQAALDYHGYAPR
ncbi:hypothetical protein [Xenorhabdus bovienii]|nr:hypothetical protein [Xenorhabdus bovienii]